MTAQHSAAIETNTDDKEDDLTCTPLRDKDGNVVAIVCSRSTRASQKRCKVPGCDRPATKQCDFPVKRKKSGTCDMYVCDAHAVSQGDDIDYCQAHAGSHAQQSLFG